MILKFTLPCFISFSFLCPSINQISKMAAWKAGWFEVDQLASRNQSEELLVATGSPHQAWTMGCPSPSTSVSWSHLWSQGLQFFSSSSRKISSLILAWEVGVFFHFFLKCGNKLMLILEIVLLTGQVWHWFQFLFPELRDLDWIGLGINWVSSHALLICVLHNLLKIFWMNSVEYIKEILAWWALSNWIFIRKVLEEFNVFVEVWPEILDRELVIMRNSYSLYFWLLHQRFIAGEYVFEKVLIDDTLIWQIVLD